MGVDVTHIIRHDFKDVKNHEAAKKYLLQTLEMLKEKFCVQPDYPEEEFEIWCEEIDDMKFRFPPYAFDFYLRDGFWQIESYFHYCQLLMPNELGVFWLRDDIYDIARTLGQKEAWHAEEYHTWNCDYCQMETTNFDSWLKSTERVFKKKHRRPIPEFDPHTATVGKYDTVYHDNFAGCEERFNEIQNKLEGYRLMGLSSIYTNYVQCERDGYVYLINPNTMEHMSIHLIEGDKREPHGMKVIYKEEL